MCYFADHFNAVFLKQKASSVVHLKSCEFPVLYPPKISSGIGMKQNFTTSFVESAGTIVDCLWHVLLLFSHIRGGQKHVLVEAMYNNLERIKVQITALWWERQQDSIKMKDTLSENCKISDHDWRWKMASQFRNWRCWKVYLLEIFVLTGLKILCTKLVGPSLVFPNYFAYFLRVIN